MSLMETLITPFADYAFMKRALVAAVALSIGGTPLGVFMVLRRMTLVGDALSHAVLPGIALAFFMAGLSLWAMTLGGIIAALVMAGFAVLLTRMTQLKEDGAFALVYLVSLAAGVALLSLKGSSASLIHVLFGNILAIDRATLAMIVGVACVSLIVTAALYRRLVIDGLDHDFLRIAGARHWGVGLTPFFFSALLLVNLVMAFQALGTLMALGLIVLPALAARFWVQTLDFIMALAIGIAVISSYTGLVISYHSAMPSGPAITLVAGGVAVVSAFLGGVGSVRATLMMRG